MLVIKIYCQLDDFYTIFEKYLKLRTLLKF